MSTDKPDLNTAYSLKTPQDSIDLYGDWAATYDKDFAEANDYNNPAQIAGIFAAHAQDNTPVLDVGAGTGLVGVGLAAHDMGVVDALDISPEMLAVAMDKGCYRKAITADLTHRIDIGDGVYGGVICVGTFTHGHVGPEAIDELLRVARARALFVLGINAEIYEAAGFALKFKSLADEICDFKIVEVQGYGADAPSELKKARSSVVVFHKR